jgi:hypothetical protein
MKQSEVRTMELVEFREEWLEDADTLLALAEEAGPSDDAVEM